ncbi:MAG: hypothetical protein HY235_15570 [Acidobacteria bacterium]|nr:hypothetical protein [Acidobacteriota bacterium]
MLSRVVLSSLLAGAISLAGESQDPVAKRLAQAGPASIPVRNSAAAGRPGALCERVSEKKNETVVEMSSSEIPQLPDWRIRGRVLARKVLGPQAVLETLPGMALDEARNFPDEWGRRPSGLAKRLANQYGQFALGEFVEFGVSAMHKEDPRYYRLGQGTAIGRTGHVFKNTFLSHPSDGSAGMKLAVGRMVGVYGSWGIATRWLPYSQQTWSSFVLYGSIGMLTKTGVNALREFWPDARRRLFHKK